MRNLISLTTYSFFSFNVKNYIITKINYNGGTFSNNSIILKRRYNSQNSINIKEEDIIFSFGELVSFRITKI